MNPAIIRTIHRDLANARVLIQRVFAQTLTVSLVDNALAVAMQLLKDDPDRYFQCLTKASDNPEAMAQLLEQLQQKYEQKG